MLSNQIFYFTFGAHKSSNIHHQKNLSGKPAINRSCTVSFLPPLIIFKIEACHAQRLYSLISLHYPCSSTYRYNLISLF